MLLRALGSYSLGRPFPPIAGHCNRKSQRPAVRMPGVGVVTKDRTQTYLGHHNQQPDEHAANDSLQHERSVALAVTASRCAHSRGR
jgi:hypothetical protein